MITVLSFYRRKPGLTHEEFSTHWREVHGVLVRDTPNISKYLRRYVQHHLAANPTFAGTNGLEFDGFSEAWFDSAEDHRKMRAEPDFEDVLVRDEHNFIDMSVTRTTVMDSQVPHIGGPPPLK